MSKDLKEKLEKELDVCNWKMLHPHFVRDSLFLVDDSVDFIDCCVSAASNDSAKIEKLIDENLLKRPSGYDVEEWFKSKPLFKCIVISPHVFIQLTDINLQASD